MVLGTAQLGQEYGIHNLSGKPSEETAYQILDYAWCHGVRTLDTAGAYGDAENLIGKYQETTGHFFHIGTKLIADTADGMVKELEKAAAGCGAAGYGYAISTALEPAKKRASCRSWRDGKQGAKSRISGYLSMSRKNWNILCKTYLTAWMPCRFPSIF